MPKPNGSSPLSTPRRTGRTPSAYPGTLIAFEGLDGSGKTTQAALLAAALTALGHDVVLTREPTDGTWGTLIRSTAKNGRRLAPLDELDAFLKDRAEHVSRVIRPALERGAVVITDRYYHSTIAYQGSVFLPVELRQTNERAYPRPDLVMYLRVDPAAALARVGARGAATSFEAEKTLRTAAAIYETLVDVTWRCFDATCPVNVLASDVLTNVKAELRGKAPRSDVSAAL
jgi:dTMP kinase